ncbi:MAG: hypothetical protein K5884_07290 [Ruminococcus sp.]|nr:hypothetical protein [Ruminococcus sp.]
MDDIMGKLEGLLSDEESVKQLAELAQMFIGESGGSEGNGMPDMESVMKLTGLVGAFSQNDSNSELLLALKPHLSAERQKKVDKAIKLLKLIAVWNIAKENGLLDNII